MLPSSDQFQIENGQRGIVILLGQRFLVTVLSATPEHIRVSFPIHDFPIEGMQVNLEFHDEQGYFQVDTHVLKCPEQAGDGLLLFRPPDLHRKMHRSSWRVPVEFKAYLKDHVHPRRFEVDVLNISEGGMLIKTDANLKMGDMVDLSFTLPGHTNENLVAKVVHVSHATDTVKNTSAIGIQFVGLDPEFGAILARYIWRRLREVYSNRFKYSRRQSDLA